MSLSILPRPGHPSQIVEAFADRDAPQYLIRDRDRVYGNEVRLRIASLHIEEVLTAPRSPWQNPYAERLIGSIRRNCLNHYVILNAKHLKRTLASYFTYYHGSRTHLGLDKQGPFPRASREQGKDHRDPAVSFPLIKRLFFWEAQVPSGVWLAFSWR